MMMRGRDRLIVLKTVQKKSDNQKRLTPSAHHRNSTLSKRVLNPNLLVSLLCAKKKSFPTPDVSRDEEKKTKTACARVDET